jgi:type I restriction enzyme M protein
VLDTNTKRRIDTARDILVGKVPDPKSQVEQITIALIYKFMDDMDAESEEFGGKRKFFANEFARYGWVKLMRSGLGGHEILNLYDEGTRKMPENPGVPPLFRSIFNNYRLPFGDPETLKMFLKVIDEFNYDQSERLGDAFEYLLSVLGSQGDAGQFLTPRHIINFIVAIVDPKKTETVLDPACGTAGFLISSYKHILKANTDAKGDSTLTPDEKGRLAQNFKGYDISPDMVRLSLVNMYLHGFADPHIHEYDTLTSQDRWNEYADVILANPPFMSPKGGIMPHKRFSVQSKRSEVLFVDYMAEHLTPNGRAGIIVPEGIIFQSQNAYTQLRKMLVEKYLVAVVSLPAGVFNPYSGVKTSILILDKSLAKKTNTIAFFKIENDGFGLGAQRREIDKNDLPQAQTELSEYLRRLWEGESVADFQPALGLIVVKEKIAANEEYNLSSERYRDTITAHTQWPSAPLSEICEFRSGLWKGEKEPFRVVKILRNTNFTKNGFLNMEDIAEHPVEAKQLESRLLKFGDILLEKSGGGPAQPVGRVALFNVSGGEYSYSNFTSRIRVLDERANSFFVWLVLNHFYQIGKTEGLQKQTSGIRNLDNTAYQALTIPLPPLEIQKEIVAEIEGYQKVINGARAVLDNYHPHIPIDPDWPMVELEQACETIMDGTHFSPSNTETGNRLYITSKNVRENHLDISNVSYVSEEDHQAIYSKCPVRTGDVLYVKDGVNAGLAAINTLNEEFSLLSSVAVLRGKPDVLDNRYLAFFLNTAEGRQIMLSMISGVAITRLTLTKINTAAIPLPPLDTQQAIVAEIEAEQALVVANRELITRFEKKIQATLGRVWGEDSGAA